MALHLGRLGGHELFGEDGEEEGEERDADVALVLAKLGERVVEHARVVDAREKGGGDFAIASELGWGGEDGADGDGEGEEAVDGDGVAQHLFAVEGRRSARERRQGFWTVEVDGVCERGHVQSPELHDGLEQVEASQFVEAGGSSGGGAREGGRAKEGRGSCPRGCALASGVAIVEAREGGRSFRGRRRGADARCAGRGC